jgi:hypothetical protein
MFSHFRRRVDWLVETNVSEKRAVSIFRAEVLAGTQEGLCTYVCVCVCVGGGFLIERYFVAADGLDFST